jgi:ferredoxin/DNA-binding MarR family transcriptional regulator
MRLKKGKRIMNDVYENLRERLDDFASGYPTTQSGVEIRILKKLFTEDEAEIFLKLSPLGEAPEDVAKRLGRDPAETAELLERMSKKGLLFRLRNGDNAHYNVVPFVPGIYDFQLNTMDREFAQDMQDYTEEGFGRTIQGHKTPIMRTIPINRELVAKWPVAPYEDVLKIIDEQEVIAVAPCVCRTKSGLLDESCGKPLETCFMFGAQGKYYVDNLMGRFIDKQEAKKIIKQNDEAGLVMQPINSRKIGVMCSCCGDCCEMLGSLKRQPVPAAAVKSNYFASVDADACSGCETCLDRCQMEAITVEDDQAAIDLDRCIGCGLCVTTCTTQAMQLVKKAIDKQYRPPKSGAEIFIRLATERNKNILPNGTGIK